jgi:RNA polymerase sigma-70 factor (ECF subfamily)
MMAATIAPEKLGRLADHRSAVTKSSVQWGSIPIREGARLQFATFDSSYLERLQRGDARTEQHFASYFGELIRLKLRSRLSSKDSIEDVRQETFVRVLALIRAKDGIRQPERLGALVNSVCNHVLLEHYRAHNRMDSGLREEVECADEAASVSGMFEADETERVVRKILGELSERDRRLLQSVLLEERDKDEVCAEFGLSRDYLRVLVHRAKQSFKSSYEKRLAETSNGSDTRDS